MTMPNSVTESLIDLARAEDFSDDQFVSCYTETERERDLVEKLKGPGAHLLEGPRGVGKSTLLKKAELELDEAYNTDKILAVYVNFKASLLVDTGPSEIGYSPFLCWVAAKLLDSLYKKCRTLQVLTTNDIDERYQRLLGISNNATASGLEEMVRDLQGLSTATTEDKKREIIERIKKRGLDNFSNVEAIAEFVRQIAKDKSLVRVNFLFDEAAHTFDERQQETFFEFFKLLHGDIIAVKAAVYPGITSYGGNFEIGQDAIKLSFSSIDENLQNARDQLRKHFRELLQKRLPAPDFGKLANRGEALDMLILLSNGNPRMFLQAISKLISSKEISKRSALSASNDFVSTELISYHAGLKKRLPRFASHIDLGIELVKAHLIPELQKKNQGKGEDPKIQTVYFTIDPLIQYKIHKSIALLEYSGFLYSKSVVKTANRKQAKRYALHLGVAANDKVFHSSMSRDPDKAIKILSLTDYREFYSSDDRFSELVNDYPDQQTCPNGHIRQTEGNFCPICGERFKMDHVIESLLNDSIDNLSLSDFLYSKVREFGALTVRDVLNLTESRLQEAYRIGPKRSRQIINVAEEYITG